MNKLRTILIEDIDDNLEILQIFLYKNCPEVEVIGIAKTRNEGFDLITTLSPDLVISDIELPGGTSFDIFKDLLQGGDINFEIIFISAHNDTDYYRKAIHFAACDFVSKPIDYKKLKEAINIALQKRYHKESNSKISVLIDNLDLSESTERKVGFHLIRGAIQFVRVKDIQYLEADATITHVHMKDKTKITATRNLGHYSKGLISDHSFFSISNAIVINTDCINRYNHGERVVEFENGVKVIASKRGGVDFKEFLSNPRPKSDVKSILKKLFKSIVNEKS